MPAPAAAFESAAAAASPTPSGGGISNINPSTGLSTDYLNHFTEALMALELAASVPECLDDLRAWQPKTYVEHFTASRYRDRGAIINAYRTADPAVRDALERMSEAIHQELALVRGDMLRGIAAPAAEARPNRLPQLRLQIARLAALINGRDIGADPQAPQAAIDAMFDR